MNNAKSHGITSMATLLIKIYLGLRILIVLSLISLLYIIATSTTYECDLCDFRIEGNKVRYDQFMSLYSEQCLKAEPRSLEEVYNLSINYSNVFRNLK